MEVKRPTPLTPDTVLIRNQLLPLPSEFANHAPQWQRRPQRDLTVVGVGELTGCDVIRKTSGQPDVRSRKVGELPEIACDLVGVAFVGDSPQCCTAARKQGNAVVCPRQTDLDELLPMEFFPEDHLLMVLKGYFDGGRDTHDKQITLATVCGTSEQWRSFCPAWKSVLDQHKAPPLHTTDAVALEGDFSESKGWTKTSVDVLIGECVDVIAAHIHNLLVVTLSVRFDDYRRAREVVPALPNSVYEICATESVSFCFKWGREIGANWYHLYFDQGEPFFGHVHDRMHHPKARRAIPLMKRVAALSELNMRFSPALQMADLFGWCINHNDNVSRKWHRRIHGLRWRSLCLKYENLLNPKKGACELVRSWKLPRRKLT